MGDSIAQVGGALDAHQTTDSERHVLAKHLVHLRSLRKCRQGHFHVDPVLVSRGDRVSAFKSLAHDVLELGH